VNFDLKTQVKMVVDLIKFDLITASGYNSKIKFAEHFFLKGCVENSAKNKFTSKMSKMQKQTDFDSITVIQVKVVQN
jgi:hypothetical protein